MEYINSLRMEKVHLFECYFLMIRMLPRDLPKDTQSQSYPCFFVIMDWRDASILDIFEEVSFPYSLAFNVFIFEPSKMSVTIHAHLYYFNHFIPIFQFDDRFLRWVTELAIPLQYPVTSSAWVGASNFFPHSSWALTRGIRKGGKFPPNK